MSDENLINNPNTAYALEAVLSLHFPKHAPEGFSFLGYTDATPICGGCDTGDPYTTPDWPCETIEAVKYHLPFLVEEFYGEN